MLSFGSDYSSRWELSAHSGLAAHLVPVALTTQTTMSCWKSPGGRKAKSPYKGSISCSWTQFCSCWGSEFDILNASLCSTDCHLRTQDWKASEAFCLLTSCFLYFFPPEASHRNQKSSSKWVIETGISLAQSKLQTPEMLPGLLQPLWIEADHEEILWPSFVR